MTDVRLYHTPDGGEIDFCEDACGDLLQDTGLETAAYLSMWGGNLRDPGTQADGDSPDHPHAYQWWGNLGEPKARQQRSETAHVLRDIPAVSSNLIRVEQAAGRDLQWFIDDDLVEKVEVSATLSGVDEVTIQTRFIVDNNELIYEFRALWGN